MLLLFLGLVSFNFSPSFLLILSLFLFADPPEFNPDATAHQHKSRRGGHRHNNDRNLSSYSYDPSQPYGNPNQGFKHPFGYSNLNNPEYNPPSHQREDASRRRGRGRGRREGNKNLNGNFGGPGPRRQKCDSDFGQYDASTRYGRGFQSNPMDGPDGPSWRRESVSNDVEQTNQEQGAQVKTPRNFGREQRRGEQSEKSGQTKENLTTATGQRSHTIREEKHSASENNERIPQSKSGVKPQHYEHQRKHSDVKRRQGPIKPPKPSQDEVRPDSGTAYQGGSDWNRSSQEPGSVAHKSFQSRGRRTNYLNKPGLWSSEKMPKSKETQTGWCHFFIRMCRRQRIALMNPLTALMSHFLFFSGSEPILDQSFK